MSLKKYLRLLRVALTPRGWLLKSRLANGAVVCGKNRPGYGGRGIYIYRDALEPEFEHLESYLDPAGIFVDIGANTGIYGLKAARHYRNQGGVVLSVEPFPEVFATLAANVAANGFTNVRLRNFCAGDRLGTTTLWMNFQRPNSFSLLKRDAAAAGLSTLTVPLDDLFAWEELRRLDFLKIDSEGAEQQILSGGRRTILRYRPIILMEINISEAAFPLPNYSVFQAPGSPNKLWIPNESPKRSLPATLGWPQVG